MVSCCDVALTTLLSVTESSVQAAGNRRNDDEYGSDFDFTYTNVDKMCAQWESQEEYIEPVVDNAEPQHQVCFAHCLVTFAQILVILTPYLGQGGMMANQIRDHLGGAPASSSTSGPSAPDDDVIRRNGDWLLQSCHEHVQVRRSYLYLT